MPLDKNQGLLLSNDELLAHLLENESNRIQLAERLPFFPVNGDTLRVERASAADFTTPVAPGDGQPKFDTVGVAVTEGLAKPTTTLEAKFELKLLVQDVLVNDFVAYNQSNVNSQVGVQLEAATRRMLYRFWKAFGIGKQNPPPNDQEFNGVKELTPWGTGSNDKQVIYAGTSPTYLLDLIDLSRLVSKVKANNGRPHVLWTNPTGYKHILKAYFDKGLEPEYVMINVPDANGGFTQRPCLAYEGIPVYQDEFYPTGESSPPGWTADSGFTSIYAMCLGRGGVYGIVPASFGRKMIRVKEVLVSANAQTTYRVYWPVGLCLEKEDAIARVMFKPVSGL